jgi:hypothetical protein
MTAAPPDPATEPGWTCQAGNPWTASHGGTEHTAAAGAGDPFEVVELDPPAGD